MLQFIIGGSRQTRVNIDNVLGFEVIKPKEKPSDNGPKSYFYIIEFKMKDGQKMWWTYSTEEEQEVDVKRLDTLKSNK